MAGLVSRSEVRTMPRVFIQCRYLDWKGLLPKGQLGWRIMVISLTCSNLEMVGGEAPAQHGILQHLLAFQMLVQEGKDGPGPIKGSELKGGCYAMWLAGWWMIWRLGGRPAGRSSYGASQLDPSCWQSSYCIKDGRASMGLDHIAKPTLRRRNSNGGRRPEAPDTQEQHCHAQLIRPIDLEQVDNVD